MSDKEKKHKMSRKRKVYLVLFALLIILAGLFTFYRINLKNKLHSKIEAMRAAGYPFTMKELNQKYSIPAGSENAADLILEVMYNSYKEPNNVAIQKILSDTNTDVPVSAKKYSGEIVTYMGQFLKENEKALEMLHKAASLQYSRYPENLSDPNRWGNGLLLLVAEGIKLLNLEAIYFSESGDSESALRSITSSFDIADSLAEEPRLIFHLVRMSYYSRNIFILKHIINRVDFTDEQLIKLNKSITNALDFSDFPNVFKGEMCRFFDALNNDDNITVDIIPRDTPLPIAQFQMFFYKHLGIVDTDRILCLDYMSRYIEAAKLPLLERYDTFEKIEEDFKKLSDFHILTTMFTGLNRNIDKEKQVITRIQAAKAAIAVKRYCLANDSLPDSLNDLVPAYLDEIPVTADRKELKYKKIPEGCIIYSEENKKNNINITPPQSDLINHGIPNLGEWFVIEFEKGVSQ